MSKNHFSYLFRKETGHSFNDYLTEVRINKAKLLLTSPQTYTIAEIAEMTGFNDTGYFGKVFKNDFDKPVINSFSQCYRGLFIHYILSTKREGAWFLLFFLCLLDQGRHILFVMVRIF